MDKARQGERTKPEPKDGEARTVVATIRWAQVLPVDFDGEDRSLTQAQLAVLK
jgi:hypothetical protein